MTTPPARFGSCCVCHAPLVVLQVPVEQEVDLLCPECAVEHRGGLLKRGREAVEAEYLLALRKGIAEPVVLLLDIRHDLGAREMAAEFYGEIGSRVSCPAS